MMFCPCFVLRSFLYKIFCLLEGFLSIEYGVTTGQFVCLSVCVVENLSSPLLYCGIIFKTVNFFSLLEYRKPFLII